LPDNINASWSLQKHESNRCKGKTRENADARAAPRLARRVLNLRQHQNQYW